MNLVRLLMERRLCSRAEAIDLVVAMADERMRRYQVLEAGVPSLCDRLCLDDRDRTAISHHVESMRDMLAGNFYWSRTCGRYGTKAAAYVRNDRRGLLAMHDLTVPRGEAVDRESAWHPDTYEARRTTEKP